MRKRTYELLLIALALGNGVLFILASLAEMQKGVEDVDNQAALLFIPVLWIPAGAVVLGLILFILLRGRKLEKDMVFHPQRLFDLQGLGRGRIVSRITLFGVTAALMLFGFWLFVREPFLAGFYALTGGALVLLLYVWTRSASHGSAGGRA